MYLSHVRPWIRDKIKWWIRAGEANHREDVVDKFKLLDPNKATREEVNAILGRDFVEHKCSECNQDHDLLVHVSDDISEDREAAWAYLCRDCLIEALAFIEGRTGDDDDRWVEVTDPHRDDPREELNVITGEFRPVKTSQP